MNWQSHGCQRVQKSCGLVKEFPLLNLAAQSAASTAGRHVSTFMSIQGQRKLARIVWIPLKSFQGCGSPGGRRGVLLISCCSIRYGSELTDDSWPLCVLGLLAEVTEVLPWTPAGDGTPSVRVADGCSAITMRPLMQTASLRQNEPAERQAGRYMGRQAVEQNKERELQERCQFKDRLHLKPTFLRA